LGPTRLSKSDEAPQSLWSTPVNNSLLEPEYSGVYKAYQQAPNPQNTASLLKAVHPVIDEALRSYAGSEANTATARARAKILTLEAVQRYSPDKAKLRTHLLSHLRGLRRMTERSTSGVYVPEQWRLDAQKIELAHNDARDELGRDPSDAELTERTGIPLERIRRARAVPGVLASSQLEGTMENPDPDHKAWERWVDGIYHDLDPVDQIILEHSTGLHGKEVLPATVLAQKINLSPGSVSQRKARIQTMLDQYSKFMKGRSG